MASQERVRLPVAGSVLALRAFLNMFVNGLAMVLYPLYFSSLGYSTSQTGIMVALAAAGSMVASLTAGVAIERADRRKAVLVGSVLMAAVQLSYILTTSTAALGAIRFIHGLVTPLSAVAGMVLMADLGGKERGRLAGTVNQWGSLGMVLGPMAGGIIMQFLGVKSAFVLASAAFLIGGVLVFSMIPASKASTTGPGQKSTAKVADQSSGGRLSGRVFMLAGVNLLDFTAFQAWMLLMAVCLQSRGMSESVIGTMMTIQSLAYAATQRACGRLADAGRGMHAVALGSVVYGLSVYAIGLVQEAWALAALMVIAGVASSPTYAAVFVEVSNEAGPSVSRAMGLLNASTGLGNALGPLLGGVLGGLSALVGFGAALGLLWVNAPLSAVYVLTRPKRAVLGPAGGGSGDGASLE